MARFGWACLSALALLGCGKKTAASCNGLTQIQLDAPESARTISTGTVTAFAVMGTYSDGHRAALDQVTWTSSAPKVAQVNSDGTITGTAAGSSSLTASVCGKSVQLALGVTNGLTPFNQILCDNWRSGLAATAAATPTCFAGSPGAPLDCTSQRDAWLAAYGAWLACTGDCTSTNAVFAAAQTTYTTCTGSVPMGGMECGRVRRAVAAQCALYAASVCAGTPVDVCASFGTSP
jgi:hypothetical protein